MNLIRADKYLTDKGYAESRTRAAEMIRAGIVRINGKGIAKPATMVPRGAPVIIEKNGPEYVSRGAFKLIKALDYFRIDPSGYIVLDCGASTGGFTDVLLQRGAASVYAVDVGYGQLHWSLRKHKQVVVLERCNLRTMALDIFEKPLDLVTLDMSFISLRLILERLHELLKNDGQVVALVKPQFEAGRGQVGAGGVVRDPKIHRQVLEELGEWVIQHGFKLNNATSSPIKGPSGNREFLFHLKPGNDKFGTNHLELIQQALDDE